MSLAQPHPDEGLVYVLTNEAMPGYTKIGLTRANDVTARLKQLDTTSVPLPFECVFAAKVPDCRKVERTLHFVFGEKRARLGREFFRVDPDVVRAILELVAVRDVEEAEANPSLTPIEQEAIAEERTERAKPLSFDQLGLGSGTVLSFSKDPDITCQVAGLRSVLFRGQELSLSAAALIVIREMGYEWSTVRGAEYWMHDGVKLAQMPRAEV